MPDTPLHKGPSIIAQLPLLILALAVYNAAMFAGYDFNTTAGFMRVQLISGAMWSMGWNDALLVGGLALLFIELMKSTRAGTSVTLEHVFSMIVFIAFLVEFLVVKGAGTNTFLMLGLMSLIDVMAGYAISIAVARKEMNITS